MAEDSIIVDIISNIDELTLRLNNLGQVGQQITGSENLSRTLPSINRELRLILGQVPGLRPLIADYFRLIRIERSMNIAKRQLVRTGEEVTLQGMLLNPTMMLTILATAILLARTILTYYQRMKIEERQYERLIRSYKDITHAEFLAVRKEEKNTRRRFPG